MKASDFDKDFDAGGNILDRVDTRRARRPALEQKRVNVDFPQWMVDSLDGEAAKRGVTRQSLIKMWLAERLEHTGHKT